MGDRWDECDALDDPHDQMACRLSHLNDWAHVTDRRLDRIQWRLGVVIVGSLAAGVGGVVRALEFLRELGVI